MDGVIQELVRRLEQGDFPIAALGREYESMPMDVIRVIDDDGEEEDGWHRWTIVTDDIIMDFGMLQCVEHWLNQHEYTIETIEIDYDESIAGLVIARKMSEERND